jgi:hypothetical protein
VRADSHGLELSAAGLWQLWVSLPVLFVLFFGWMWRQFVWCRFVWRLARFDLNLVAAHPDGAGGLRFLGAALWGYAPLAFALGSTVAGALANHIRGGASFYDFRFFVVGLVVVVLALFVGPFLVFVPPLRRLRAHGVVDYGMLSCAVGHAFEAKWINNEQRNRRFSEALEAPDFSATTDLYGIASNVYQIRYFPLSTRVVGELIVFALVPFVPVVLFSVPIEVLLRGVKEILL